MLSPDSPQSPVIAAIVVALLVGVLLVRAIIKGRTDFVRFKAFERTANRQRMMRKWLFDSVGTFGGAAAILLIVSAQYIPLFVDAVDAWGFSLRYRAVIDASHGLLPGVALAGAVLFVGMTIVAVYLVRHAEDVPTIGDIASLLPRTRGELQYGIALSINAGVVEELLFRLAVPALLFAATSSAMFAIVVSVVLFGLLHIYQGWPGIISATIIGVLLMALYLGTGSILVAIIAHALIDLRSLVLIPMMLYGVHRTIG